MKKGLYTSCGFDIPNKMKAKYFREFGFDCVLLNWADEYSTDEEASDMAKYAATFIEEGLTIENAHLSFRGINAIWEDNLEGEAFFKKLCAQVKEAASVDIKTMVTHLTSGYNPPQMSEIGFSRFNRLVELAVEKDVKLAFENLKRLEYLDETLTRFHCKNVGLCFDFGHNNCFADASDIFEKYKDRLMAIHVHDNFGDFDSHVLPFTGGIDWGMQMSKLMTSSYRDVITLEVYGGTDGMPFDTFLEKASKACNHLIELCQMK